MLLRPTLLNRELTPDQSTVNLIKETSNEELPELVGDLLSQSVDQIIASDPDHGEQFSFAHATEMLGLKVFRQKLPQTFTTLMQDPEVDLRKVGVLQSAITSWKNGALATRVFEGLQKSEDIALSTVSDVDIAVPVYTLDDWSLFAAQYGSSEALSLLSNDGRLKTIAGIYSARQGAPFMVAMIRFCKQLDAMPMEPNNVENARDMFRFAVSHEEFTPLRFVFPLYYAERDFPGVITKIRAADRLLYLKDIEEFLQRAKTTSPSAFHHMTSSVSTMLSRDYLSARDPVGMELISTCREFAEKYPETL